MTNSILSEIAGLAGWPFCLSSIGTAGFAIRAAPPPPRSPRGSRRREQQRLAVVDRDPEPLPRLRPGIHRRTHRHRLIDAGDAEMELIGVADEANTLDPRLNT
jgi:hypothetical protein